MTDLIETMARAMWDRLVGYPRIAWNLLDVEDQDVFRAYARAAHAAIEAAGYRVVPVEMTEEMRIAAATRLPLQNWGKKDVIEAYEWALAAAPKVTE